MEIQMFILLERETSEKGFFKTSNGLVSETRRWPYNRG